jgi:hypothetical protein
MEPPAPKKIRKINKKRGGSRREKVVNVTTLKAWLQADKLMDIISRNKTPSQRLSQFFTTIDANKFIADVRKLLLEVARRAETDKDWCESNFELQNPDVFGLYALAAFDLNPDVAVDGPILQAFHKANLDPKNPLSWRVLMMIFCWSHFPPKRSVGDSTSWTSELYCQLLREIHKLKPQHQSARWESAACERLSKKMIFKRKNRPQSGPALRRALLEARDPKHNAALSSLVEQDERILEQDYKRGGHVWPPVHLEGALARVREIERARKDEAPPADLEDVDQKDESAEYDGKDNNACFNFLQGLRARNHAGLLRELLAAGTQTYDFLLKFLQYRRANDHDALRRALIGVDTTTASSRF